MLSYQKNIEINYLKGVINSPIKNSNKKYNIKTFDEQKNNKYSDHP